MSIVSSVINYLAEVRAEMAKVTWPTRQQAVRMTILVIIISVVIGIFIGGLDYVLTQIVSLILQR